MGGVGRTEKRIKKEKHKQTNKRSHPDPSTEWGVGRKKENAGTKLFSPIRPETPQTLTLKFRKHLKQPKEKGLDHETQKTPETTKGEKPRSQDEATTRNNPRRKTQKHGKLSSAAAVSKSTNHARAS